MGVGRWRRRGVDQHSGVEQHGPASGEGDEQEEQQHQKVDHVAKEHAEEHHHKRAELGRDEQHTDYAKPEEEDGHCAQRSRPRVLTVRRGVDAVDVVAPVGREAIVHASQPPFRVAADGHDLAGLPQESAQDPDEQQRRDGRRGEVGCREEREREGEGQVRGALEAELYDGEAQEVNGVLALTVFVSGWHQRHEREENEQLQQEHDEEQSPDNRYRDTDPTMRELLRKRASPDGLDVLLHHRLRQQLLGLDLDSILESLATVVAEEQLLHISLAPGLSDQPRHGPL
eukprot:scaffold68443_cov61-Phaeocystis_antarctica.AAC.3